jgi:magnesium transporter
MGKNSVRRSRHHGRIAPRRHASPGTSPGTIAVAPGAAQPLITVVSFTAEEHTEKQVDDPGEIAALVTHGGIVWVDVGGLGNGAVIAQIGKLFGLHPLALEDVVSTPQRPKVEAYDDHFFCVLRVAHLRERLETEQIGLFVGKSFVITFREGPGDYLKPVRERLRKPHTRMRRSGTDYLAYAVIDAVVDLYYPLFETFGERLEAIEDQVLARPTMDTVARIHDVRHDLLLLRRAVWPLREVVDVLMRGEESDLVTETTRLYLRDCYDHAGHLMDVYETCRDIGGGLMEAYRSAVSVRTDEVMRVLTVIATIFIPLTFIAGVYGMNFNSATSPLNMPELDWYWGYPFSLTLMGATTLGLLQYFRHRGWFESQARFVTVEGGSPSDAAVGGARG